MANQDPTGKGGIGAKTAAFLIAFAGATFTAVTQGAVEGIVENNIDTVIAGGKSLIDAIVRLIDAIADSIASGK